MEEAVQKGTVLKEKIAEIFIDGKNTMAVLDTDKFEGHTGRTFHGIFITAGRAKAAVTAERNKFKVPTVGTAVHGTAKRRIAAVDHFINVFHLGFSGMESIFNFFIMICDDFL